MDPNKYDPSPRNQRRNGAAEVTAPAPKPAEQIALPAAPQKAPAVSTVSIAVMQGVDTLAASTAPHRPFSTGSTGYNLSAKVAAVAGRAMAVRIGDSIISAMPKAFSTGSHGWYASGKVLVHGVMCQVGANLTIVGSKLTGEPADGSTVLVQVGINVIEIGSKAQ